MSRASPRCPPGGNGDEETEDDDDVRSVSTASTAESDYLPDEQVLATLRNKRRPCDNELEHLQQAMFGAAHASQLRRVYLDVGQPVNHRYPTLSELVSRAYADSTNRARRRVFLAINWQSKDVVREVDTYIARRRHEVTERTLAAELYHVAAIAERFGLTGVRPLIHDLTRALRKAAAKAPTRKALPLTPADLNRLCSAVPLTIAAFALLCFRTASRVAEVAELLWSNLSVHIEDGRPVLLVTFAVSKTNPTGDPRPDHQIRILAPESILLDFVSKARRTPGTRVFSKTHTVALREALKRLPATPESVAAWQTLDPRNVVRVVYTGHSLKRGAASLLWQAVAAGTITLDQCLRALKHKTVTSAVGYAPCPRTVARALTGDVTLATAALLRPSPDALRL
jgi:integrase